MKRRGFIKGFLAAVAAAPAIVKGKPTEDVVIEKKPIGFLKELKGRPVINGMKHPPREGDMRFVPLQGMGVSGSDMLCGNECEPNYEVFRSGKWRSS